MFGYFNNGGMTLMVEDHGTYFSVAKAICSKKDQYNRKVGRSLCEERMLDQRSDVIIKTKHIRHFEHIVAMYRAIVEMM
jgi:hypothetical protein